MSPHIFQGRCFNVALSCRGIIKSYGDLDVLKGIDLDINEGERIGIVGANGAGKTTLAGLIFGSLGLDEGSVRWGRREAKMGYLLQSSSYLLKKGEEDNHLEEIRFENSDVLSGGERTRLSLSALLSDSSFYLLHGDRTGIVGSNGCGKSALLKLIAGEENADSGEIWMSSTAGAIYISQDVQDLDPGKRPLDLLEEIPGINFEKARQVFASLGIDATMFFKKLSCLSQGERMRVKLAMAILEGSGFFILDEPTNHLDLFSRERLEDALAAYEGTILMVSHDRYLLERVCEKLLVFENGCIKPFYGRFGEYLTTPLFLPCCAKNYNI